MSYFKVSLTILFFSCFMGFSSFAQKLAKSFNFTYDEQFNPYVTVKLENKLKKQVAQVVYVFQFGDFSGWEDTSVSRALKASSSTTVVRTINLKPGYASTDKFRVPQLPGGSKETPLVQILRIRYADGTIDDTVSQ
ncbi:hypothetical protein [Pedobacter flavus]|uniref:Uncharacterized protein n=1 Tax=Pedobacter flavus TaxID=3113906 RepID=A0ABU7GZX9_9SPHI|nr:hypothetical protein [Pedobacter sp. VNH31]MEE1884372.1 hypothetical protein [Pedobacter sp. VNH31]